MRKCEIGRVWNKPGMDQDGRESAWNKAGMRYGGRGIGNRCGIKWMWNKVGMD